jgi:hypothetical protein
MQKFAFEGAAVSVLKAVEIVTAQPPWCSFIITFEVFAILLIYRSHKPYTKSNTIGVIFLARPFKQFTLCLYKAFKQRPVFLLQQLKQFSLRCSQYRYSLTVFTPLLP